MIIEDDVFSGSGVMVRACAWWLPASVTRRVARLLHRRDSAGGASKALIFALSFPLSSGLSGYGVTTSFFRVTGLPFHPF